MKLLIVEDEKKTGEYLTKGLTEAGFVVDLADNGLNGYHLAMTGDYDLIILDIMLPDVNGWDIVRMLRSANKGMPILLLTALGTIEHRVKGLELGAIKGCRFCCLPRLAPLNIASRGWSWGRMTIW